MFYTTLLNHLHIVICTQLPIKPHTNLLYRTVRYKYISCYTLVIIKLCVASVECGDHEEGDRCG